MRLEWKFSLGAIQTYVRTTQKQKWVDPQYKKYRAFKLALRASANLSDVPMELDPKKSYSVHVDIYCVKKRRGDVDNYLKSALDALWKQDKQVTKVSAEAFENKGLEMTIVTVVEK